METVLELKFDRDINGKVIPGLTKRQIEAMLFRASNGFTLIRKLIGDVVEVHAQKGAVDQLLLKYVA